MQGGKGDGPADPSKVQAFGPGVELGKVRPGHPTDFIVDSSKTGPATLDVNLVGRSIVLRNNKTFDKKYNLALK